MLATSSTALWMEYELQARALSLGVHWKMTTGDAVSQVTPKMRDRDGLHSTRAWLLNGKYNMVKSINMDTEC